ncbi:MAG: hypothetical protein EOO63_00600 [Hymenobacter sp.]|nr:MAG: hypothetical protein EOO63_00600 [Hymenobacter sp.]
MEQVVARFLQLLRVPVAPRECEQLIRSHPDYPALTAVSDSLDSLGVNNYMAQFEGTEVDEIPFPYLTHLARDNGELVLITNRADLAAARAMPAVWTGIIVQADGLRTPASAEQVARYQQAGKLALVTKLVAGLGLALLLEVAFCCPSWLIAGYYIAALVGLVTGWVLIAKDLGVTPRLVEEFCGGGTQAGCDEVIQANPVQLFGFFTLSDAAAAYFSWQVGVLAVASIAPAGVAGLYPPLGLAALLGMPVVAFSLYYQYTVAKAWCRLCLVIDAVLLLQAGLAGYTLEQGYVNWSALTLGTLLNTWAVLFVISGLVVVAKQWGLQHNELQESESLLQQARNSLSTFTDLLLRQPQADTSEFSQELALGNPTAPIEIIMVGNPYCAPCKKQHEHLAQLVALYPEQLHVRFRFTVSNADTGRFPTATHYLLQHWLTANWGQPDERVRTATMLHDWYAEMNLERFAATHSADFTADYSLSTHLSTQHYVWVKKNGISRTPTIFINGYMLPAAYRLSDLKLLLPSLAEFFSQATVAA